MKTSNKASLPSKWWAPTAYMLISKNHLKALSLLDDPSLGIGDSIFLLAYMGEKIYSYKKIYLEPRAYFFYKKLCADLNAPFPSTILKPSLISRQFFKAYLVSHSTLGRLSRLIFRLFILFHPRTASLTCIDHDNYIDFSKQSFLSSFNTSSVASLHSAPTTKCSLTFYCARQDSFLSSRCVELICKSFNELVLVQHFLFPSLLESYIHPVNNIIDPNSYFGRDPYTQITSIRSSSILIAVASSAAKFAITIGHPLLLILFTSHNLSFTRYYQDTRPSYSDSFFNIYRYSSNLVVLKFNIDNASDELPSIIVASIKKALSVF